LAALFVFKLNSGITMSTTHKTQLLVLGSGPAGLTAAIYAARAGRKPLLVRGMQPGGQLTITTDVENYPGFAEPIMGPWLMEQMEKQAEHVGTQLIYDHIQSVDLSKRPFTCIGESGDTYLADTLVIATGATAKWLGIPSEQTYSGFGVSACATCDGPFFKNQKVFVVGGGNSAVEEALYLSNIASHVTVIHRRESFRAEKILQDRLLAKPNVTVLWNSVLEEITGEQNPNRVTGVRISNVKTGDITTHPADGVFIAIGHAPNTELFKGQLEMDATGYLITAPDSTKTTIEGVYAAGDVQDSVYRQAVTAAGTGCMAALEAERFLNEHGA
jgi:thioredoxin reductase (NADPH)